MEEKDLKMIRDVLKDIFSFSKSITIMILLCVSLIVVSCFFTFEVLVAILTYLDFGYGLGRAIIFIIVAVIVWFLSASLLTYIISNSKRIARRYRRVDCLLEMNEISSTKEKE
jgi:hypothetical protein